MHGASLHEAPAPRFRIERAARGYRVLGPGLFVWEPSLGEALALRDELEAPGWRHPLLPRPVDPASSCARSVVYGPVQSRRLGRSLGVDLTPPGCRVCTFECVYCEYPAIAREGPGVRWPTPGEVASALANTLPGVGHLDSITFSGHGEPTLHPRFGQVVADVIAEARRFAPGVPVRILTNGARAADPAVRRALDLLDERIVKLDADPQRICRPRRPTDFVALVGEMARLRDVTPQCCFVEGELANDGEEAVDAWIHLVAGLKPRSVQIYTIDRPPAAADARPVAVSVLEEIACRLRAATGIEATVYP